LPLLTQMFRARGYQRLCLLRNCFVASCTTFNKELTTVFSSAQCWTIRAPY